MPGRDVFELPGLRQYAAEEGYRLRSRTAVPGWLQGDAWHCELRYRMKLRSVDALQRKLMDSLVTFVGS